MDISVMKAISDKLHREIMVKQLDLIFICVVVALVSRQFCGVIQYTTESVQMACKNNGSENV